MPVNLNTEPQVSISEVALGDAQMETFTVIFDKFNQPKKGTVVARLDNDASQRLNQTSKRLDI